MKKKEEEKKGENIQLEIETFRKQCQSPYQLEVRFEACHLNF